MTRTLRSSALVLLAALAGCDPATPRRAPTTAPASRPAPSTQPASAPATQPASRPALPEVPPYIRIVAAADPLRKSACDVLCEPAERRLIVDTANIARLEFSRQELPLPRERSVALRVDGRVFEWTPAFDSIVIERRSNGDWVIVERQPRRP